MCIHEQLTLVNSDDEIIKIFRVKGGLIYRFFDQNQSYCGAQFIKFSKTVALKRFLKRLIWQ